MPAKASRRPAAELPAADYQRLLGLRTAIRRFEHWSSQQSQEQGLTSAQHQLLLAVRGHDDPRGPTIKDLAGYLFLRHQSAAGLVERTCELGLLRRSTDADDRRAVRLRLTPRARRILAVLSSAHLEGWIRLTDELTAIDVRRGQAAGRPLRDPAQP
jgi:DNA-binding MarR family transcriptional regulator